MRGSSVLLALLLVLAACGSADTGGDTPSTTAPTAAETTTTVASTPTTPKPAYPVTVEADNGPVTIDERPDSIVSLSATATEMLFAIGAGDQVVAVDDQSNHPEDAPTTDLSGFTPNVEAILSYEPDLVVLGYDPGELVDTLDAAGVAVINYSEAMTLDDTYRQIEALGVATGHVEEAVRVNESIQTGIEEAVRNAPDIPDPTTYYHELDDTYFSATSSTFIGQIYSMFGLENVADEADEDGSAGGYPQLSSEYIVAANPDLIFLANTLYGGSAERVAERPGWDAMTAVQQGNIIALDSDVASRWGPRVVEFAGSVSDALVRYTEDR